MQDVDHGGGCCRIVSTVELRGEKIRKTKFVMVLGGRQSRNKHNNQPNTRRSNGGWIVQDGNQRKSAGGTVLDRFEGSQDGR